MKKFFIVILMALLVPAFSLIARAERYDVEGRLKKVYSDFITVDYQADTTKSNDTNRYPNGELALSIDAQTHYDNFSNLNELMEGDYVGINLRKGVPANVTRKVAASVARLEPPPPVVVTDSQVTTTTVTTVTTNSTTEPDYMP